VDASPNADYNNNTLNGVACVTSSSYSCWAVGDDEDSTGYASVQEQHGSGGVWNWTSSTWSGYVVSAVVSAISSVTGRWSVPAVTKTTTATDSSTWIGIGGFTESDPTLIQIGTEQDWRSGAARYSAWWEIFPSVPQMPISLTIHAKDVMTASIVEDAGGKWTLTIADLTSGKSAAPIVEPYSGAQLSAEWIQEAPRVNGGAVSNLAHYGRTTFDLLTVNGANPGLEPTDRILMVQQTVVKSTPSTPDSEGDGFTVAYGAKQPAPPAS
jgi:hypothetical protein